MPHISEYWYKIAMPQDAATLSADRVRNAGRLARLVLLLFPLGALSLFASGLPVLLVFACMWIFAAISLVSNRQGYYSRALYWCVGSIQAAFFGLSFVSGIGLVGVFYVSVFLLLCGYSTSISPANRLLFLVLCINIAYYAGCLIFAALSDTYASPHLLIGFGCLFVGIVVFLRSQGRARWDDEERCDELLTENQYLQARVNALIRPSKHAMKE